MELTDKDLQKIKALHVTTKISVHISDLQFKHIKTYCSDMQYQYRFGINTVLLRWGLFLQVVFKSHT